MKSVVLAAASASQAAGDSQRATPTFIYFLWFALFHKIETKILHKIKGKTFSM